MALIFHLKHAYVLDSSSSSSSHDRVAFIALMACFVAFLSSPLGCFILTETPLFSPP